MFEFRMVLITVIFVFFGFEVVAQNDEEEFDVFSIRNVRSDLSIEIVHSQTRFLALSDYGGVLSGNNLSRYTFQGQEFDKELGVFNFIARLYSYNLGRFLQPDPNSQYFSPYLFVGGDAINIVDRDGREGKPLILYSEETRHNSSTLQSASSEDMQASVDGYYESLTDFMNGDVFGDFSEWNGNVFIQSHISDREEVVAESYFRKEPIQLEKPYRTGIYGSTDGAEFSSIRSNVLGDRIGEFSLKQGIPLNNIVVGGCEGEEAARAIGQNAYEKGAELGIKSPLKSYGLKRGHFSAFIGKRTIDDRLKANLKHTGLPKLDRVPESIHFYTSPTPYAADKVFLESSSPYVQNQVTGEVRPVIRGQQFNDLVNARIPRSLENSFAVHSFPHAY